MIEVRVIEIESAEKIRIETEKAEIVKENERIKQEQIDKENLEKESLYIAEQIKNKIASASKNGNYNIWYTFYNDRSYVNFKSMISILKEIFEKAGYEVYYSSYSDSWTYKSGKIGYLDIRWYK